MKTIIYCRVSTQLQDTQRQVNELKEYAAKMNYEVLRVFQETISGVKKNVERPELMAMLEFARNNAVDKVLCWELSRIGRNTAEILNIVQLLTDNKISLFVHNMNVETLNIDKSKNIVGNLIIEILGAIGSMEREQIRQRMKSGYEQYKKSGAILGRRTGTTKTTEKLLFQHNDIIKLLKQGLPLRHIAKITGKSSATVQKVKNTIK